MFPDQEEQIATQGQSRGQEDHRQKAPASPGQPAKHTPWLVELGVAVAMLAILLVSLSKLDLQAQEPDQKAGAKAKAVPSTSDEKESAKERLQSRTPKTKEELLWIQKKVQSALEKTKRATVGIIDSGGAGSGVIVSKDGLVLTAGHVSGKPGRLIKIITPDGKRVRARTLGLLNEADAGMIKILKEGDWPFVDIAEGEHLPQLGDWCFALGHPGGFDKERGVVLRVGRLLQQKLNTIQSDCKLLGGDSGGPLFDLEGKLIGIHSRIAVSTEQNYHAPVQSYKRNWDAMLAGDTILPPELAKAGYLGVQTKDAENGIELELVSPDTAAEKAGLKNGDIILKLDGTVVAGPEDFSTAIRRKLPGDKIKLELMRKGKKQTIEVTLGRRGSSTPEKGKQEEEKKEDQEKKGEQPPPAEKPEGEKKGSAPPEPEKKEKPKQEDKEKTPKEEPPKP